MMPRTRIKITGPSGRSIRRTVDVSLPKATSLAKKLFGDEIDVKKIPSVKRKR